MLLMYVHLMKDRPMRSIVPVPQKSLDLMQQELHDPVNDVVIEFISRCSPTDRPATATVAADVDEALLAYARTKGVHIPVMPSNLLKQKGFAAHRAKRAHGGAGRGNVWVYKYKFVVDGVKAAGESYVVYDQ
jgi:hypothetical protein